MRTWLSSTLLALAVLMAPACKEPDPYKFETHIERIRDSGKRAQGFSGLENLVKTVVTSDDNKDRLEEFATKVVPVLDEVWADVPEHQEKILIMLRDVARPEGSVIWNKAIALDGSAEARQKAILSLEGIRKAKAKDSAETVREQLNKLIENPKNDQGNEDGRMRVLMCETLGELGDKAAVPLLIKVMEQPKENQPTIVHRAAATALGKIGDPAAVQALLTVTFRVPDETTSKNIGERAKQALVAIGEPAIPDVVKMLKGQNPEVQKLAAAAGLDQYVVAQTAANILGVMGSPQAVDDLIAIFPTKDCTNPAPKPKKEAKGEDDEEGEEGGADVADANLRAFVANALGLIGDPKAADTLCVCATASKNPGDMFEILTALGRVGGPKAVECLSNAIRTAEYTDDAVTKDFKYEARWNSVRFAVLAATIDDLPKIKEAAAANTDPKVKQEIANWDAGIAAFEKCKSDKDCWLGVLRDSSANWFAREKAAFELSRLADNDKAVALEIAKAYKVRDPDARVTMAWLAAKMLHGKTPCGECAAAIEGVLEAEKLSTDAKYQAAVLLARSTIAKLEHGAEPPAAKKAAN